MYAKGLCITHYFRQWRAAKKGASAGAPVARASEPPVSPPAIEPAPISRYRAWHKELKRMLPVKAIFFPTANNPLGSVELHGQDGQCTLNEVILMTRAGFTVKTGALHDGDLIRDDRYDPPERLYRVGYRPDFGWDAYVIGGDPDDHDFILDDDGPHIEVVGNIYENPDLPTV